jgi:hypothetical protein
MSFLRKCVPFLGASAGVTAAILGGVFLYRKFAAKRRAKAARIKAPDTTSADTPIAEAVTMLRKPLTAPRPNDPDVNKEPQQCLTQQGPTATCVLHQSLLATAPASRPAAATCEQAPAPACN